MDFWIKPMSVKDKNNKKIILCVRILFIPNNQSFSGFTQRENDPSKLYFADFFYISVETSFTSFTLKEYWEFSPETRLPLMLSMGQCCGIGQATPEYASVVIDNFELNLLKKQPEAEATEAGTPILWPRDAKSRLIRKDPDAEKD